ncbi:MAG TPA: 2-oxoacid ferredoxin oxidoreductase [Nitrospiraceae bacterium]|nr:2-oxoacid ferredoxin oxidoreductase [Nitrospiraceae bacterium]
MPSTDDYTGQKPAWCPGCGNFGILRAVKQAFVEFSLEPHQVLLVSGIGQAGKLPHYMRCNTFNGLHGRTLPVATGAKLTNHELTVVAVAGDGDCYGEGGNHLIHAIRRNINITLIVHNNQIYGLTKGQASPTSGVGMTTKVQPDGVILSPFNPIALGVSLNASFVARGFSGDVSHLTGLIKEAINHKGFSMIDILQPCVTFNMLNTFAWYRERVYKLDKSYNPEDRASAFEKSLEWGEKIPIGVIYKSLRQTFEDQIPTLKKGPLVSLEIGGSFDNALQEFY